MMVGCIGLGILERINVVVFRRRNSCRGLLLRRRLWG
jgi:hypothetical protein